MIDTGLFWEAGHLLSESFNGKKKIENRFYHKLQGSQFRYNQWQTNHFFSASGSISMFILELVRQTIEMPSASTRKFFGEQTSK